MRKVFITDDSEMYIEIMKALLSDNDFVVEATTDALETIEKIKSFDPDVIVIDLVMPDKSGTELIQEIRSTPDICKIPILLISANPLKNVGNSADDFIEKAEEAEDIKRRLRIYADIGKISKITQRLK